MAASSTSAAVDPKAVVQFLNETSCRHIPSFALGALFLGSLTCMVSPSFLSYILARCRGRNFEEGSEKSRSLHTGSSSSFGPHGESRTLHFLLAFFFASASLALFASLPAFPANAKAACAFVRAWGAIATQSACIIGLLILFLDLRRLGIHRWEIFLFLAWLVLAVASVIVVNILATGQLPNNSITSLSKLAFCEKQRNLPASVASSLVYIVIDLYTLLRLWTLLAPQFMSARHRYATVTDARILRAASLLTLELLVIYPSAVETNILLEYLPYSLGALLVLAAFSMQIKPATVSPDSIPSARYPSMSVPPHAPTTSVDIESSQWRDSKQTSHYVLDNDILSMTEGSIQSSLPTVLHHPFSARSLSDPRNLQTDWQAMTHTSRSSHTIDTGVARNIRNAIVNTAASARQALSRSSSERDRNRISTSTSDMHRMSTATTVLTMHSPSIAQAIPLPTPATARPRLVVFTSPAAVGKRTSAGQQQPPDSGVLRPIMQGTTQFRLTPTFVSPGDNERKRLPMTPRESLEISGHGPSNTTHERTGDEVLSSEGPLQRQSGYTFGHQRMSAA